MQLRDIDAETFTLSTASAVEASPCGGGASSSSAPLEELRERCEVQRALLERQAAALAHEEQRRGAVEARVECLNEEVDAARLLAAGRERAELEVEAERLRGAHRAVELQAESLGLAATPPRPRQGLGSGPRCGGESPGAPLGRGAGANALAAALDAAEAREAQDAVLRAELQAEAAAVRRAYHRAEEQQLRNQALLERAQQQASRAESQVQELRAALVVRDGAAEERIEEARRVAARSEAAQFARVEAGLRAEFDAEREALYARVHGQLVALTSARSPPGRRPWSSTHQQFV